MGPYPTSPSMRSSLPFPYSTARPPTGFSEVETAWSQPSHHGFRVQADSPPPPIPNIPQAQNPFSVPRHDEEDGGEGTADLYERSDWDEDSQAHRTPITTSAWSRSSWAGPTTGGTGLLSAHGRTGLDEIAEHEEWQPQTRYSEPSDLQAPAQGGYEGQVQFAYDQGVIMDSPVEITSAEFRRSPRSAATAAVLGGVVGQQRRSTLPSALALGYLDDQPELREKGDEIGGSGHLNPFTDPHTQDTEEQGLGQRQGEELMAGGGPRLRPTYAAQHTPELVSRNDEVDRRKVANENLMSPGAHQKLGRMSVAPARYTLPPQRAAAHSAYSADPVRASNEKLVPKPSTLLSRLKLSSSIGRKYLTYRPFVSPVLTMVCALILTVNNGTTTNALSGYVTVASGVFEVSRAGDVDIVLGAWGWCQANIDDPTCEAYSDGDFSNSAGDFLIPDNSTLSNLSSLLIALTTLTWLLAVYQLTTAFFHFYLFFSLSIPLSHFADIALTPPRNMTDGAQLSAQEAAVVAEVDLRVRCQLPPYEYGWVWWTWWVHRRSPLGPVWSVITTLLALGTFITAVLFKRAIISATKTDSSNVLLSGGAYVPFLFVILTLDTFAASIKYFTKLRTNFHTFLKPPEPSAAALLLPASERPLHHFRKTNASSFFAPRQTLNPLHPTDADGFPYDPDAPPVPDAGGEYGVTPPIKLDAETIRWLEAYPHDEELVSLISDLRMGRENDDLLLSEVGLLYLRPEVTVGQNGEAEGEGAALLVPPKGVIRQELLEDAHLDSPLHQQHQQQTYQYRGTGAHNDVETMLMILSETFWWNKLSVDVRNYVDGCAICKERRRLDEIEAKTGMTEVPFTGVTGAKGGLGAVETGWKEGESAMAVEMAVALRRAQEEAERQ